MRATELVEEYLLLWVLVAVALGFLVPGLSVITRFSTPILAVMVGSVSLALPLARFRGVSSTGLAVVLAGHVAMPLSAFVIARLLGLSPAVTAGFVLLGAVTPELVTPTLTELAGGDTALASTALVTIGVGSTAFIPATTALLLGDAVPVRAWAIVEQLLVAVVAPMTAAVVIRTRYGEPVARHEEYYSTISALMVVLIICGVAAENAALVRTNAGVIAVVGVGVLGLNVTGYALGWLGSLRLDRETRIAATLSIGMRDFAVAAALVVSAGFPPAASLPAVLFGIVEMTTSAGIVRWIQAAERSAPSEA